MEEPGDPLYDARRVNAVSQSMDAQYISRHGQSLHLTLKVLHDIQKFVVDFWLLLKLDFDSIQIAESIGHIEGTIILRLLGWRRLWG